MITVSWTELWPYVCHTCGDSLADGRHLWEPICNPCAGNMKAGHLEPCPIPRVIRMAWEAAQPRMVTATQPDKGARLAEALGLCLSTSSASDTKPYTGLEYYRYTLLAALEEFKKQ